MLYLAPPYLMVDGVSVMRDHADPLQWYYLPLMPHFTTRHDAALARELPQFQLIKFRSAAIGNGGFVNFDVNLGLGPDQADEIARQVQRLAELPDRPHLAPVPLLDGSVRMMLFGQESGPPPAGGGTPPPRFVLKINHPAKPSLFGDNQAAFSVQLDEFGVTILERAMQGELSPIGIVYALDYLALRPAYNVRLRIDWDRTQDFLDETHGHEGLFDSVQITDTVEKLIEDQHIVFEVDSFVPEDGEGDSGENARRDAAVAQVREMITDAFFESSLPPLREAPTDWDKGAEIVKSFAPERRSPWGVFTYKKTHYSRVDRKVLDVNMSERTTVKRTIYPQGHLAGFFRALGAGMPLDALVLSVDADDPWFKRRSVRVVSRADFANDPVRSVDTVLRYGETTRSVLLDPGRAENTVEWASIIEGGRMREAVSVEFTVNLKPSPGAERPLRLVAPPREIRTEAVEIEPRELFTIEPVPVLASRVFPWDRYPEVQVELRFTDEAAGIRLNDVVQLSKEQPSATWPLFALGQRTRPYEYKISYRAANHRDHLTGWLESNAPQVNVGDPFPRRLKISIVPNFRWEDVERAFVDVSYEDAANGVFETQSFEFTTGVPTQLFTADLVDPTRQLVTYRVTTMLKDGTVLEAPSSATLAPRIIASADVRGHRVIRVRPPADFVARRIDRAAVDLRYEHLEAGLSFADRFEFRDANAVGVFEFDYVDQARSAYEFKSRFVFANGQVLERDWRSDDADELVLPVS